MRNKYKNLQNRGQSQKDNSYITEKNNNNINSNTKYNNINKNSFISNFDNKEKIDKMINQINDKEKKPYNEKRYASSFIANDSNISIRSSNHNIFYSVYKKENKDNNNKKEIKQAKDNNNNIKIDYFSSKYYNVNKNVKINTKNNKETQDNKINKERNNIKINLKTEIIKENYNNKRELSKNNNNSNNNEKNNKNDNNKTIKINTNHYNSLNTSNSNTNNIRININNKKEKENDYKRIKWDIKEQKLKILDNNINTTNYNSTTNINNISNKNKIENLATEKPLNNKRMNYNKNRPKEYDMKETKAIIKKEEKEQNQNIQSENDIFSNKINRKKITYRSKRTSNEDEENVLQIENTKNNRINVENKNKITENNKMKKQDIKKFDNEDKINDNNIKKEIKSGKYIKELTKTPNIINTTISETEPKTEDCVSQKKKFRRFFYFKSKQNKENKENIENEENKKKEILENIEHKENNDNNGITENNQNKEKNEIIKNKENKEANNINKNIEKKESKEIEENNKKENINKDNKKENIIVNKVDDNTKEIKKKRENHFLSKIPVSPIPQTQTKTESNISPELNLKSPQSQTIFKRINTYMYKMNKKHSFKDIIHEVNLNKDFHNSFTNIFQSCKNDINNKNNSRDLNKSFSCFSNSNGELKLNLDENIGISQYLKVNLKGKKSSDINNYRASTRMTKEYSPSNNLIYKKKMNLIKTISTKYKKSIPNFIFNSINNVNNKRNNDLTYYGNIINNNTYNTTLNIFTDKETEKAEKFFDINNISRISNKKHLRTNSESTENKPFFYSQIFYSNKEKEKDNNNLTYRKIKSLSTSSELSEIKKNDSSDANKNYKINLEILYIVESKLQNILSKINNYIICPNECFDLITYYFSSKFYEKEINLFKIEQNRINISHYIKLELLCYFLCYDVCFNKSFSQTGILLKTIFNLLHNNYLILVSFILNESEKYLEDNLINNEYSMKLKHVIKNNLKMKIPKQNLDENFMVNLIGNNLKQVSNYYKMIIDNLYSHFYLKKNNKKNYSDVKYKFPQCLQLDIDNLDYYEKLNIISLFFFDSYNKLLNNHKFEEMKYFFDSFLQRITKDNKKPKSKSKNKPNKLLTSSNTTKNIKNVVVYKYNYNGGFYYLPPMKKYYKYTLVLDLDETLIYLMPNNIYLTDEGKIGETRHSLIFRPGLIDFLKKMKSIYELVIFSFGTLEYVDSVLKIIEKKEKFFENVLYRQHATVNNGEYIKDLSLLGRNLKNIIIVDDISQVFKLQEKNGICIKPFYGDVVSDRNTLKILGKILEKVRFDADEDGDIRKSLEKQRNLIFTHITNGID